MPQAKFYYNSSINRSIEKSSFQIFYGQNAQGALDLLSLPLRDKISDDEVSFIEHLH